MGMSPQKMVYGKACHLPLLSQNIKHIGQLKNSTMTSNLLVKRGYLILAHQMNGEPKLMKMPNCSKKKLKDDMTKESKSGNSKLVNMFYCKILIFDFLQENFFPNGQDYISSKKFIALDLLRSIMPKALVRRWSMDKELSTIFQVRLLMLKLTLSKP